MTQPDKHANAENVRFMDALPSDERIAADLIYDSGYEIFDYSYLNSENLKKLVVANWPQNKGFFTHANTKAAYFEDRLVGIELGFDNQSRGKMIEPHIELGKSMFSQADDEEMDRRWLQLSYILPAVDDHTWYLSNLAVHPDARGRGIGEQLLQRCFRRAKQLGYSKVALDVCHKKPAVNLYLRVGMVPTVETRLPQLDEAHNVPMHIHMVKDLAQIETG